MRLILTLFLVVIFWIFALLPAYADCPDMSANSIFCSWQDADDWLNMVDPVLFCRGELVQWTPAAPDCYYTGDAEFSLIRSIDNVFSPSLTGETAITLTASIAPTRDYLSDVSPITQAASVEAYKIDYHPELSSRVLIFRPVTETAKYAIYHEGHTGIDPLGGINRGSYIINWLLDLEYNVVAMDMPLFGQNIGDRRPGLTAHMHLDQFDNGGGLGPIELYLTPVKSVVDWLYTNYQVDDLVMVGKSGGGWTAFLYAIADDRPSRFVIISGVWPMSYRGRFYSGLYRDLGDYEQNVPFFWDDHSYEAIMLAIRDKTLFTFSSVDPCCFRLASDDPFAVWMGASGIDYYIHNSAIHGIDQGAMDRVELFLAR